MTKICFQNALGRDISKPIILKTGRRQLATIVKRHAPTARPFLVSVHPADEIPVLSDATVRLRDAWRKTFVGPNESVVIMILPLGGGGGGGGGGRGGKAIGLSLAAIALMGIAPFAAPALGLAAGSTGAFAITGGLALAPNDLARQAARRPQR